MSTTLDLHAEPTDSVATSPQSRGNDRSPSLHITWVNQHAALTGGAEHYIFNTVRMLNQRGVRNSLLYDVDGEIDPRFTQQFAEAYPMVETGRQLQEIGPDLIYAHRIEGADPVAHLTSTSAPAIRFFHDHKLFCLREHKYRTIGHQTCTQATGLGCYSCLGFLAKSESWPGVRIQTLGQLQKEQEANKRFDGYVVGSDYMAEHIAAHGFDQERTHTIPLFALEPIASESRQRDRNQLLFAGALLRGKGLDVLLDAISQTMSDAKLTVAGSGRQEDKFRQQVDSLQLNDRVEFVGKLSSDEISERLQSVACVVSPSRSPETFGLSGLEAFSHGAPVIASNVGGMGAWLKHEVNGLFFPSGDAPALAEAIDRMILEEGLAERLGENARRDYQQRFKPENHIQTLTSMFHEIVARHRAEG